MTVEINDKFSDKPLTEDLQDFYEYLALNIDNALIEQFNDNHRFFLVVMRDERSTPNMVLSNIESQNVLAILKQKIDKLSKYVESCEQKQGLH